MPIHDWTRVAAGVFHDFHHVWIAELRNYLNGGALPSSYYALAEQVTQPFGPDVLTLKSVEPDPSSPGNTAIGVLEKPPKVKLIQESDAERQVKQAKRISVRHVSDDRVVAVIEIMSPGNKSSQHAMKAFLGKIEPLLEHGIHLLLVDLFPPTRRDPHGIHCLIWGDDDDSLPPNDQPLTLVAYVAGDSRKAFVEPTRVGAALTEMRLFLDELNYVPIPLETTYQAAWRGVPQRWKAVLEV